MRNEYCKRVGTWREREREGKRERGREREGEGERERERDQGIYENEAKTCRSKRLEQSKIFGNNILTE